MTFRRARRLRVKASLDMTPYLNIVFQLILFFMLGSTFVVHNSINIRMAEAKGAKTFEQKDLSITLMYGEGGPEGKGPIYVNDVQVKDMNELSSILAQARAEREDLMVLIRPDARIESARLIEVLGIATSVGIERYGIVAQPPSEEHVK